jgi:CrcB protein
MAHLVDLIAGAALVALGAIFGTPARFYLSGAVARRFGETFPWGTLVVNGSGCLAMGITAAYAATHGLSGASGFWLLAGTGFLGSYTTVSSFALQTRALARDGEIGLAAGYVALSVLLCLAAVTLGFRLGSLVFGSSLQ